MARTELALARAELGQQLGGLQGAHGEARQQQRRAREAAPLQLVRRKVRVAGERGGEGGGRVQGHAAAAPARVRAWPNPTANFGSIILAYRFVMMCLWKTDGYARLAAPGPQPGPQHSRRKSIVL